MGYKDKNVQQRREALREELKSREYIRQVHVILETPDDGLNVPAAKLKMDGYFRLLAKTLPDVKAVELSGSDGEKLDFLSAIAPTTGPPNERDT